MLSRDMPAALTDPSFLLFHELPVHELLAMFTDADARALAIGAGFTARNVSELADEVTRHRALYGE